MVLCNQKNCNVNKNVSFSRSGGGVLSGAAVPVSGTTRGVVTSGVGVTSGGGMGGQPFPRNVPSRSTFHSGQNRQRPYTGGAPSPTDSARTSFFSKLSSKFSKRSVVGSSSSSTTHQQIACHPITKQLLHHNQYHHPVASLASTPPQSPLPPVPPTRGKLSNNTAQACDLNRLRIDV